MRSGPKPRPLADRFWSKVDKESGYFPMHVLNIGHCWLWTAATTAEYGTIGLGGGLGNLLAHRAAWILAHGSIPDGLDVCHRCDIRPCVNIAHLFLGTDLENMRDKETKGRGNQASGEAHGSNKLSATQVVEIRELYVTGNYTQEILSMMYGVTNQTINAIVHRRTWKGI